MARKPSSKASSRKRARGKPSAGKDPATPQDISRETPGRDLHESYEHKRERAATRDREQTRAGRDIGELPPVENQARRDRGRKSLQYFCETYFPERFKLAWSQDHLKVLAKIETAVREGGLFAMAMPRGSGKTTCAEVAVDWAILYGFRQFIALIGSDETSALELLASIKIDLETNDLLFADFPEACYPIRCLDGISHRCRGQLYRSERTHIGWQGKTLVMPTIAGSASSGTIVKVAGITGRIRGMKHARPDGKNVRPDLFVLDDGQTDESARSPSQCEQRESILAGAIIGLAGPSKKIAGILPCTVIKRGDMADRILNRKLHPQWQGERMRLIYEWPKRQDLWDKYAELRAEELANDRGIVAATAFYKKHRKDMDTGARVAWPARHNPDELSALQHAVNLKLNDPVAFESEFQNDPPDDAADGELLTVEQICAKVNGYKRRLIPQECTHVTSFIDVQGQLLYWLVAAWSQDFTGYVIDYGAWPDQQQRYFTLSNARHTLERRYRGTGLEGRLRAGLVDLVHTLVNTQWPRDDGMAMSIEKLMIDANWGQSTDVVYQFVRESPHKAILLPTHGRGVKASEKPMGMWTKKPGEQCGLNWRIRKTTEGRAAVRHGIYDTNFWKSFVHARFAVAAGDRGCLSLWGRTDQDRPITTTEHRMIAEHCRAEDRTRVEAEGRKADEWRIKPGAPDNHEYDCLAGAAVGASMVGCVLPEHQQPKKPRLRSRPRYFGE
jgi:hypothetical protein